jgi:integrase/recombinase XerD
LRYAHLQSGALLTAARRSADLCGFALVAMLGLPGLQIFEATSASITDPGEEHGHRVLRVFGKGTKVVLVPLLPVVGRPIDRAIGARTGGPILLNSHGTRSRSMPLAVLRPTHQTADSCSHRRRHLAAEAGVELIVS